MVSLDIYIVNISLPTIAHHFDVSTSNVAYVVLAYLLVISSTLLIFGKLCDRFGSRKIYIFGFCFFTIGSFLCGVSPTLGTLVGSRCLQGIGGAMLCAVGPAMIPRYLPKQRRGWAFGINTAVGGLGMTLGAPLGGFITQLLSWNWIFLVNVPLGIAAIFLAGRFIPAGKAPATSHMKGPPFDVVGAVLSLFGLLFLVYALNRGQEAEWDSALTISAFLASAVLLVSFIMWEKRCHDPLLDLGLLRIRGFFYGALASAAALALYGGSCFLLPFYLICVKKLSPGMAGLVLMTYSVVYMVVSPFMGRVSDKVSPRILCASGMALATLTCIFFASALQLQGLVPVIVYCVSLGISYAMFTSPSNNLVLSVAPEDRLGIASGAFRTIRTVGMVIGVTLLETIFSLVIPRTALDTSLTQVALPQALLISGFRNSYIVGALMCGLALVFSFLARGESRSES